MGNILIPVDFTQASSAGINKAKKIAEKQHSDLHVVNFISPPKIPKSKNHSTNDKITSASKGLDQTLNVLKENEQKMSDFLAKSDLSGNLVHSKIVIAPLKKGIAKYISKHKIDQIVVGVNKAHTVGDLFCKEISNGKTIQPDCAVKVVKT